MFDIVGDLRRFGICRLRVADLRIEVLNEVDMVLHGRPGDNRPLSKRTNGPAANRRETDLCITALLFLIAPGRRRENHLVCDAPPNEKLDVSGAVSGAVVALQATDTE